MTQPAQMFTFISDPNHTQNLSGRVTAACQNCHQKKIKCSGDISCDQCRHRGIACPGPSKRKRPSKSEAAHARPLGRRRGSPASAPAGSVHSASSSPKESSQSGWALKEVVSQHGVRDDGVPSVTAVWSQSEAFIHPLATPHHSAAHDKDGVSYLSSDHSVQQQPTIGQSISSAAAFTGNFEPYDAVSSKPYAGMPETSIAVSESSIFVETPQPSWNQSPAGSGYGVSQTYYEVNAVNDLSSTTTVAMVGSEQFYPPSTEGAGEAMWDPSATVTTRIDFGNPSPLSPPEEAAMVTDYLHIIPQNPQQLHATYGAQPAVHSEMSSPMIYYGDVLPPGVHRDEYGLHDSLSMPRQI